jgi:hypothetical protein
MASEKRKLMAEILTIEEMAQRYDGEWLLIAYTEMDEDFNVIRGEVIAHSPNQEDIYNVLPERKNRAIEYVGKIPKDLAFML